MFQQLSSDVVYNNPWLSVREDRVVRPGGSQGIFGIVTMRAGATVVAVDDEGRVLLTEEYKYALGRNSVELISGGLDTDESPLECAKRELAEEAGVYASEWVDLGRLDPFTTVIDSPNYMFLARGLVVDDTLTPDEGEIIRIVRRPLKDVIQMVLDSDITHGASCVAVLKAVSRGLA